VDPPRTLRVHGGDPAPVMAALESEPCDGATSLGALAPLPGVAYYVLVSDGFSTIGGGLPERLGAPVYTLTASILADHALLAHLARWSGGQHLPLTRLTPEQAAARIGRQPDLTVSVEYDPSSVADVSPAGASPVEGRVTVTGRLLAPEARVTLRYRAASGATSEKTFELRRTSGEGSGLVPRLWAQRRAEELMVEPERRHDELVALGKAFGIVTPGTSLLVLETLDQYLRHQIEPPESSGEFRAEYLRLRAERKAGEKRAREDKIERVLSMWRARVAWWETKPLDEHVEAEGEGQHEGERARPRPQAPRAIDCAGAAPVLSGKITDFQGGFVPGAEIVATNQDTGASFQVQSGVEGNYVLCRLPPGPYAIRVAMPGFRTSERRLRLPSRGMPSLDIVLEVGAVTETIAVMAADTGVAPSPTMPASATAASGGAAASIEIKPWDPDTPYLAALKGAGPDQAYAAYLQERASHAASPAFFLDCAEYFLRSGRHAIGLRVLSSILDLRLEDPRLLRVVAHRLQQLGELDLAIELFERVRRTRREEPQSPRDLALALAERGDAGRARKRARREIAADYLRALDLLNEVVLGQWDGRFPAIEVVALMDANRLIAILQRERLPGLERVAIDPRLRRLLDVDLRITLTWDTDETDMDLWVTEPTGEKCDYSHNRTAIGGMISNDFTGGYGPEEYLVRHARAGVYRIQANFYGSRQQSLTGPTTAQATVITHFGRPNETRQTLTLRLTEEKEVVDIGSASFGGAASDTSSRAQE
jgi:Ca-activated chloride channel family protein